MGYYLELELEDYSYDAGFNSVGFLFGLNLSRIQIYRKYVRSRITCDAKSRFDVIAQPCETWTWDVQEARVR